jgi:cytoskeletal protein CcmA (bactofilin family)
MAGLGATQNTPGRDFCDLASPAPARDARNVTIARVNVALTGCDDNNEKGTELQHKRMRDRIGQPATILGPGLRLTGRLEGKGHFLVSGTVIGDAEIEGSLTIAESGDWQGNIRADDVVIAGHLEGELQARGAVEIAASARVSGRVIGGGIAIAQGAVVEAELQVTGDKPVKNFEERRQG